MGSIAHWWLSLWVLAGMLLPGIDALRLCGCDGSWSLGACACEQPAQVPASGCCSYSEVSPTSEKAPRVRHDGRAPCTGCVVISTAEPTPGISLGQAPSLLPWTMTALQASSLAEPQRVEALVQASRGHDPPGARRNRELRV